MSSTPLSPLSLPEPPRAFGAPALHTDGDLLALGLSADGLLWSVEEPGELRGWNLRSRRQVSLQPLEGMAMLWAFNWASRLVASASDEVTVWEVASGDLLATWRASSWVSALAFQPRAAALVTGHDDGTVCLWDWNEQTLLRQFNAHQRAVSAVAFSSTGQLLATAGEDKQIHLWDVPTGELRGTLSGHKDRIPGLVWHPDGQRLFSAGWDTTVRVWDVATCQPIILLNSHATQVHAIALSADGKLLASADSASCVHLWDTDRHETLTVLREPAGDIRALAFKPDDDRGNLGPAVLAYGGSDRLIRLWDSKQGVGGTGQVDPLAARSLVAVSPDQRTLYGLGAGMPLRGWAIDSGEPTVTLADLPTACCAALSPDGAWIAAARPETGTTDRTSLALYDSASGVRVAICDGQPGPITAVAIDATSRRLASAGYRSADVWLWQVPQGTPLLLIPEAVELSSIEALAFHPTAPLLAVAGIDWLATSGRNGQVALWNVESRQVSHRLDGGATAVAWHPDGQRLITAGLDSVVRVWDATSGQLLHALRGSRDPVTCLAVSPDGQLVAAGADDRTLWLWDVRSGDALAARELDNAIKAVIFSRDGRYLFTANGNTSCYQLEVEPLLAGSE